MKRLLFFIRQIIFVATFCGLFISIPGVCEDKKKESKPAAKPAAAPKTAAKGSPSAGGPGVHSGPTANGRSGAPNAAPANKPSGSMANRSAGPAANASGRTAGDRSPAFGHSMGMAQPKGAHAFQTRDGSGLQRRPDGRVRDVYDHRRGMEIHHGLDGNRRIMMERPDHSRVFAERGRPGFVGHPFAYHGRAFERRTYFYHGRPYSRFYRGYEFHGVHMYVYAPYRYYGSAFYGWAYNPWARPVVYVWGWGPSPWYGYYGAYFVPEPVYPGPALWLTDYIISQDLQAEYQARQEAQLQAASKPTSEAALTPEVKQAIAEEVRRQIALENDEAQKNAQNAEVVPESSGIVRMLADKQPHVFVAGSVLDVVDSTGTECEISDGDVLQLLSPPASDAVSANLVVMASKGGTECKKSSTVTVALSDLQEMQNHMRESIDRGLEELQANQGKKNIPTLPPSAQPAPTDAEFVASAPPQDTAASAAIEQQLQAADSSEKEVLAEVQVENSSTAAKTAATASPAQGSTAGTATTTSTTTATITLGQSPDEVTAILGPPVTIVDLGAKKIYKYKEMKITFQGNKVSDVE